MSENTVVSTETLQSIDLYEMPHATPGMPILWYPRGTYDRTTCTVAYMIHCGHRTAVLLTSTGQRRDAVRHVSDPKLQLSEDQRENGAWDFTDEHKRMQRMEANLMARLDAIEYRLGLAEGDRQDDRALPKRKTVKNGQSLRGRLASERLKAYHAAVRELKALNVEIPGKATIKELNQLLDASRPGSPSFVDGIDSEEA